MDQLSMYQLSDNHPLRIDPEKPWPWKVLVGYRAPGARKIKATRSIYLRAAGDREAESGAIRQAREMPLVRGGQTLICSRVVSSRPLDKHDAFHGR
ncbi:hypothetical protein GCM10011533_30010 [Streptosporangium jomthongense]|nr:hypothetical protein GCM10011533_30010 [Streptosporangium jomthongense]